MKQAEIEVGGEYLTRISGALVRVKVLAELDRSDVRAGVVRKKTRFSNARWLAYEDERNRAWAEALKNPPILVEVR